MSDERIDLSSLRTPPPLGESDYAAVRARVLEEIARRERRRWVVPLQIAAAIGALIVVALLLRPERETQPTVIPSVREESVRVVEPEVIAPQPAQIPRSARNDMQPGPVIHKPEPRSEPMRIHIQTADPDIRIIWIVPEKEES